MQITVERSRNRKKPQFSKCWLAACIVISVVFSAASFFLAAFDKNPVSDLSIEIVKTMWGADGVSFFGYIIQNCVRAYTASKFGIVKEDDKNDT